MRLTREHADGVSRLPGTESGEYFYSQHEVRPADLISISFYSLPRKKKFLIVSFYHRVPYFLFSNFSFSVCQCFAKLISLQTERELYLLLVKYQNYQDRRWSQWKQSLDLRCFSFEESCQYDQTLEDGLQCAFWFEGVGLVSLVSQMK